MRTKILLGLSFFFLLGVSQLQAQRIAIVDINKVLENIQEYRAAQDELDQLAATWRQDIAKEYDKIKGLYNRYQAEQVLLSDEARKQKEDEIMGLEQEVRDLQKKRFGPEGDLFERRKQLVEPIQDRVYSEIELYANEKGYDFIFDKGGAAGLLFSNDKFEKTNELLNRLKN